MGQVVAIIADIVGSRELADRDRAQLELEQSFDRVRELVDLAEPFHPTVGDEFQAVASDPASALTATLAARLAFPDGVDCRFGLGHGDSRAVRSTRPDGIRDGSAWWRAREAIEAAHGLMDGGRTTVRSWYLADGEVGTINAYLVMRDHVISRMKRIDRELAFGRLAGRSQQELARAHGVSQSAVSQRLERSGASALLATVDFLGGGIR